MKALSLRQPWAWLIVNGIKDIENRKWATRYRGHILVHASRTIDEQALAELRPIVAAQGMSIPEHLPTGGIVGEVTILDCVTTSKSPWFTGPYGFVLTDHKSLPFHPCRGKLGLFDISLPQ